MKLKVLTFVVICISSFISVNFLSSCTKKTAPKVLITVKDETGAPVGGAIVVIYSDPSRYHGNTTGLGNVGYVNADDNKINFTIISDDGGQALFTGFKNECILNVKATKGLAKNDTIRGEGAVILKMNQTVQETVTLR